MTISINQQVDFLWKKLGFNVAKTEELGFKDATNESITSAPFIPGDKIWTQSELIPAVLPSITTNIVEVHNDATSSSVQCVMDNTARPNRTWLTNKTDWIPTTFGSTYQVKVYLAPIGTTNPQVVGTQLYAMGSNNDDEWYFDHESGVLNFIGTNLPALDFTGNTLFVCGGVYKGFKGVNSMASGTFGNISISGNTITSSQNLIFAANGAIIASGLKITNVGYPVLPTDAATVQYVTDAVGAFQSNAIWQGDSSITITDPGVGGQAIVKIDGTQVASFTSDSTTISNVKISNGSLTSTANLVIDPGLGNVILTNATTAFKVPTGDTLSRPTVVDSGYIRYNTSDGVLEVFNGSVWLSAQARLATQTIYGNGVNSTFTLDSPAYASDLLVVVNGVVQNPSVAYVTSGNTITFAEIPTATDVVVIRYISQSVSTNSTISSVTVNDTTIFTLTALPAVLDAFSVLAYRAAKYMFHVTLPDGQTYFSEVLASHNGTDAVRSSQTWTGPTGTLPNSYANSVLLDVQINAGIFQFIMTGTSGTVVRLQKNYF
jgi:hypothetical protein